MHACTHSRRSARRPLRKPLCMHKGEHAFLCECIRGFDQVRVCAPARAHATACVREHLLSQCAGCA
eukprot:12974169-Alexandrium_andersonii.AAC.1